MAARGIDYKWYDGVFLSMLATSTIIVAINWKRYHLCSPPLQIWIVVDYTTIFVFRLLVFIDNWIASKMGLDFGSEQRDSQFRRRIIVLSVLVLLMYPFLWAWTIIGTIWFTSAKNCLPGEGHKWAFIIWLLFSFCGLVSIAGIFMTMWLTRRRAHISLAQHGVPISEFRVLIDMIKVPNWAFNLARQEMIGMRQDNVTYQPGLYLTTAQREAVESLIEELPKFRIKAAPTDCTECLICLEEFRIGNEVRGLPCAHNFHVECIDEWLRLNVRCPRCRSSVFPNLNLTALSNNRVDSERSSNDFVMSQSYRLRLQGILEPVLNGDAGGTAVTPEGGQVQIVVDQSSPPRR